MDFCHFNKRSYLLVSNLLFCRGGGGIINNIFCREYLEEWHKPRRLKTAIDSTWNLNQADVWTCGRCVPRYTRAHLFPQQSTARQNLLRMGQVTQDRHLTTQGCPYIRGFALRCRLPWKRTVPSALSLSCFSSKATLWEEFDIHSPCALDNGRIFQFIGAQYIFYHLRHI